MQKRLKHKTPKCFERIQKCEGKIARDVSEEADLRGEKRANGYIPD